MISKKLSEHRIKEIKTMQVSSRYTRTIERNSRIKYHGDGPDTRVRAIITDKGAMGWGASYSPDEKVLGLVGCSVAELFDPDIGIIAEEAMPLDYTLHDLAGVIMDIPVHKMLGGKGETSVPCYDGAIYMDDLIPEANPQGVDIIVKNCQDDYKLGYRAFKLKIGRGLQWMEREAGIQQDIDVTLAMNENLPDCRILVDGNDAFTCDEMIHYMDAVADCNIFWIEEPFRENKDDLIKLKKFLEKRSPETLVVDGESRPDVDFLLEMAKEKLLDGLQMDVSGLGFTRWRQIMPRLVDVGVPAAPHTWGDPLKVIYSAHLAAGLGNFLMLEGIPSTTHGADMGLYRLEDGILHVPEDAPGFGMKLTI